MTPETTPPAAAETLEEIADRIATSYRRQLGFNLNNVMDLNDDILSALRNERERCAKLAWSYPEIAAAIREGK